MAASITQQHLCPFDAKKLASDILTQLEGNQFYKEVFDHLHSIGRKVKSLQDKEKAETWLRWAKHNNSLKIVHADVPLNVLPQARVGEVIDVKVFSKRGPDDEIYDRNKEIREKVARGNCFLEIQDGPSPGVQCVLQGLRKFTGGLGDDDDREKGDNFVWQRYFTKSVEESNIIIATRKANGEAAHLSCRLIDGEYLICGGSKNVHMVFRKKEDIHKYGEDRFRIAREVCETVMDALNDMEAENRQRLLDFLVMSQYTGIFEILSPDHQHVEDLSHLPGPQLRFITWTQCELEPNKDVPLCMLPPHIAIEIARGLGLQTVDYEILPLSGLEARMKEIRQGYQYEGEVLYFIDSDGAVIGLLKKKTIWYIMCRAIREKIRGACHSSVKNPSRFSISNTLNKVETRIDQIQQWLSLDSATVTAWKELAGKFIRWTMHQFGIGNVVIEDVVDRYPVVWKRFLQDSGEMDQIVSKANESSASGS